MFLVLQRQDHEHPEVGVALADLRSFQREPACGDQVPSHFLADAESAREFYLQANRLFPTALARDEQIHAAVFGWNPHVVFVAELPVDVISDQELTLVDGEQWLHRGVPPRAINSS